MRKESKIQTKPAELGSDSSGYNPVPSTLVYATHKIKVIGFRPWLLQARVFFFSFSRNLVSDMMLTICQTPVLSSVLFPAMLVAVVPRTELLGCQPDVGHLPDW